MFPVITSAQPTLPPIFRPIQRELAVVGEYESTLYKLVGLTAPFLFFRSEIDSLKSLCHRVVHLNFAAIYKRLISLKQAAVASGKFSESQAEIFSRLEAVLLTSSPYAIRSAKLMSSNLDLLTAASEQATTPSSTISFSGTSEKLRAALKTFGVATTVTAIKFPKTAASIALSILQGHEAYERRAVMGRGSYGVVSQIIAWPHLCFVEKQALSDPSEMLRGAAIAYAVGSSCLAEIVAIGENNTVLMQEGQTNLLEAFKADKRSVQMNMSHYVGKLLEGLAEIHRSGFAHQDIKPSNIFLVPSPLDERQLDVVIGDFDTMEKIGTKQPLTGTAPFISPEVYKHTERDFMVSAKSDIWSLGITLYHLLSDTEADQSLGEMVTIMQELEQETIDGMINELGKDEELINSLIHSKVVKKQIASLLFRTGIDSAPKLFLERGLQLFRQELLTEEAIARKSPEDLTQKGFDDHIKEFGEDRTIELMATIGLESMIAAHGREGLAACVRRFALNELRDLQTLLSGLLRINPHERFSARTALILYQRLERAREPSPIVGIARQFHNRSVPLLDILSPRTTNTEPSPIQFESTPSTSSQTTSSSPDTAFPLAQPVTTAQGRTGLAMLSPRRAVFSPHSKRLTPGSRPPLQPRLEGARVSPLEIITPLVPRPIEDHLASLPRQQYN